MVICKQMNYSINIFFHQELTVVIVLAVYIPPDANVNMALSC